ncbi:uncharacterized protein LOC121503893 [Cheilinus undulatus]|uniref:uncharacterized protein LOC121503893 n=1 Tax=Cheilinus undulatus TaxID=241271 RepID=UPI001BD659C4|nr:uncharacterized protein LOC121503893 [Cheilinus undulatus]
MNAKMCLFWTLTVALHVGAMQSCTQKNTTCEELKSQNGFMYLHECPDKSQIYVTQNETKIAVANFGPNSNTSQCLREGMSLDYTAFYMGECQDVHIKCVSPFGEKYVKDSCLTYTITEKPKVLPSTDLPLGPIVGVSVAVIVLGGIAGLLCWCFFIKKRAQPATPLLFSRVCTTKGVSEIGEAGDQRPTDGISAHSSTDPELDVAANQDAQNKLREIQSEIGLSETEENEKNSDLESNVDSQTDREDPKSLREDLIIIDETQSSENENKTVPGRASSHRPMHRHLRGDPGGVTYNKAEDSVSIGGTQNRRTHDDGGLEEEETEGAPLPPSSGPTEWSAAHESTDFGADVAAYQNAQNKIGDPQNRPLLADRSSEEDETEGDPLLPSSGAAIQFSDMTGEAETLVDGAASPPDQARKFLSTGQ